MESRELCARCRAKSIRKSDDLRERCRSEHALEKKMTYSSRRRTPECLKFHKEDERKNEIDSCFDKFALAKRLHTENLQHQPLPDRVDDSVFRKEYRVCSPSCERDAKWDPDRANPNPTTMRTMENRLLGPALGCKKPETRMDLAICWETPIDPVYEPRRPTHIDGSEGSTAPAIFAMIQHIPVPKNRELLSRSEQQDKCNCARQDQTDKDSMRKNQCCCAYPCKELRGERRCEKPSRSNSVPRITERKCAACRNGETEAELEQRRRDPRLIRSAVGVALGLEEKRWPTPGDGVARGLPPMRMTVPRPRTPFARRAFCIDTLAPPFSVVNGCRDTDYPEHWRLMSVYQQSYRNPQKRRARRF